MIPLCTNHISLQCLDWTNEVSWVHSYDDITTSILGISEGPDDFCPGWGPSRTKIERRQSWQVLYLWGNSPAWLRERMDLTIDLFGLVCWILKQNFKYMEGVWLPNENLKAVYSACRMNENWKGLPLVAWIDTNRTSDQVGPILDYELHSNKH